MCRGFAFLGNIKPNPGTAPDPELDGVVFSAFPESPLPDLGSRPGSFTERPERCLRAPSRLCRPGGPAGPGPGPGGSRERGALPRTAAAKAQRPGLTLPGRPGHWPPGALATRLPARRRRARNAALGARRLP